jgi:hypothetical protein
MWNQDMLNRFAKDIESGALVNRAVSEADTGSPNAVAPSLAPKYVCKTTISSIVAPSPPYSTGSVSKKILKVELLLIEQ